ncbi:protein FAR1-RELATED SEQUENCE 5-like [Papaver somniferum]|uniref:protein FAR1-RELATED SEQUENCE 5-like n=1 Tax=Papaver somniferum TaxID=3469 RepID=UPI000E6F4FD8|nr:protein FAR1-RELATED SEQUENCE 5-like [Papaver somniferum]
MDYYYFGDVVCFDPTYSTNRYDMPFVRIVGINHHNQTVLFGGSLLYSESEYSFEWLMKTWMRAMYGKTPKVIPTDQESAIGGVIARVLPGTRHRYCLWHISRNAMKNLSDVTKEFVSEFKNCLYGNETVEQFVHGGKTMLANHKLQNNKWLLNLYEKREYWASVYTRDIFCGDMYTTQRSESINSFFYGFLKRNLPLCEFVRHFERAVVARREAENNMDYETNYSRPVLRFRMVIEENAALVHVLKVFIVENIQNLPSQHVLKRWTRDAKSGTVVFDQGEEISSDRRDTVIIRYSKLCQDAINIAVKGSTYVSVYTSQFKMHVENVGNLTNARELVGDPPIVKRKGKNGAMKSWIDKLNNKRKSTETKARKKLRESTRGKQRFFQRNKQPTRISPCDIVEVAYEEVVGLKMMRSSFVRKRRVSAESEKKVNGGVADKEKCAKEK